jgi:hypothetical protein
MKKLNVMLTPFIDETGTGLLGDALSGDGGKDTLISGSGDDTLQGSSGNDAANDARYECERRAA